MEYQITKEECQNAIDKLQNVCQYCGGKIEPIDTINNAGRPTFWPGCMVCQRFTEGCKPRVFKIAEKMVKEHWFNYYESDGSTKEYNDRCNIGKAAEITELIERLNKEI